MSARSLVWKWTQAYIPYEEHLCLLASLGLPCDLLNKYTILSLRSFVDVRLAPSLLPLALRRVPLLLRMLSGITGGQKGIAYMRQWWKKRKGYFVIGYMTSFDSSLLVFVTSWHNPGFTSPPSSLNNETMVFKQGSVEIPENPQHF